MNTKQTWWLTGTAIALFLFIVLFERHQPGTGEGTGASTRLLTGLRPDLVTALEITSTNAEPIRLSRSGRYWKIDAPIHYPADWITAERWLRQLEQAIWIVQLTPEELAAQSEGPTAFGLDPARVKVVLQQGDTKYEVRFGNDLPVGGQVYARVNDDPAVLVTDGRLLSELPRTVLEWRDRALINFASVASANDQFLSDRIEVRPLTNGFGFTLQPDPATHQWRLTDPINTRADGSLVSQLIQWMAQWQIAEFVTDDPAADLASYHLDTPELELSFVKGTNNLLSVQFGGSPSNAPNLVYARQPRSSSIVLTARTNLSLLKLPYSTWRDKLVLSVKSNAVEEIRAQSGAYEYRVARVSNLWQVVEPEVLPVDDEYLAAFFLQMNSLQITSFETEVATDFSPYGLAEPARKFSFVSTNAVAPKTPALAVAFGTNQTDRAFARRMDEEAVYEIEKGRFAMLPAAHWQWRARDIWSFKTNEVRSVIIEQHGRKREVNRTPEHNWLLAPGSTGVVDLSFADAVEELSKLRADSWVGVGAENRQFFGFTDPPHTVSFVIERDGVMSSNRVTFGGLKNGTHPYAAVELDGRMWIFDFPIASYYGVVKKNFTLPASP